MRDEAEDHRGAASLVRGRGGRVVGRRRWSTKAGGSVEEEEEDGGVCGGLREKGLCFFCWLLHAQGERVRVGHGGTTGGR